MKLLHGPNRVRSLVIHRRSPQSCRHGAQTSTAEPAHMCAFSPRRKAQSCINLFQVHRFSMPTGLGLAPVDTATHDFLLRRSIAPSDREPDGHFAAP
jgi:hypothetical protein